MKILSCALAFLCLLVGGAFLGFEQVALDPAAYDRLQAELDIYEYVGVSRHALPRVNIVLTEYLRGKRDNIDIEEELLGERRQVFNEDEKAHMTDVVGLFRLERAVRTGCLASGCIFLIAAAVMARKSLLSVSLRALGLSAAVLLALAAALFILWTTSGFDRLFILFHQLLFTNDLWLMDPATDAMIRMFPADFFRQIALKCGANALAVGVALPAAAQLLLTALHFLQKRSGRKQTQ